MNVSIDTNVLVRAAVGDDEVQWRTASEILRTAETVAIPMIVLCEFAWTLKSRYRFSRKEIYSAIAALLAADNMQVDRAAANAGLRVLQQGGDFADGVIAFEGARMGGNVFVSFDKQAVDIISETTEAKLLQ